MLQIEAIISTLKQSMFFTLILIYVSLFRVMANDVMFYKNDEVFYNGTSGYVQGIAQDIWKKQNIGGLSISVSMYQVNVKLPGI